VSEREKNELIFKERKVTFRMTVRQLIRKKTSSTIRIERRNKKKKTSDEWTFGDRGRGPGKIEIRRKKKKGDSKDTLSAESVGEYGKMK